MSEEELIKHINLRIIYNENFKEIIIQTLEECIPILQEKIYWASFFVGDESLPEREIDFGNFICVMGMYPYFSDKSLKILLSLFKINPLEIAENLMSNEFNYYSITFARQRFLNLFEEECSHAHSSERGECSRAHSSECKECSHSHSSERGECSRAHSSECKECSHSHSSECKECSHAHFNEREMDLPEENSEIHLPESQPLEMSEKEKNDYILSLFIRRKEEKFLSSEEEQTAGKWMKNLMSTSIEKEFTLSELDSEGKNKKKIIPKEVDIFSLRILPMIETDKELGLIFGPPNSKIDEGCVSGGKCRMFTCKCWIKSLFNFYDGDEDDVVTEFEDPRKDSLLLRDFNGECEKCNSKISQFSCMRYPAKNGGFKGWYCSEKCMREIKENENNVFRIDFFIRQLKIYSH